MDRHASQEDGLPVQQNVLALYLDRTEADAVFQMIAGRGDLDVVEFRVLWRPALEVLRS